MLCEYYYLGVDDLSLVGGMLQEGAPPTVVAWRPFIPYLSLYYYLDTSDNNDGCINE